jgi:predicted Zn-dependent protease
MGHSSNWKFGWQFPTSTPKQTRSKQQVINDIEEMLAAYHHKVVKTYDKELHDEKEAKLKTVVEMNAEARAK